MPLFDGVWPYNHTDVSPAGLNAGKQHKELSVSLLELRASLVPFEDDGLLPKGKILSRQMSHDIELSRQPHSPVLDYSEHY